MWRLFAVYLLVSLSAAHAGEVADNAAKAEVELAKGDAKAAIAAFQSAQDALWRAMPLTLLNITHTISITSVGIYEVRPNHVYKRNDVALIYFEPFGFAHGKDGFGNNTIEFSFDAGLKGLDGAVIFQAKDLLFDKMSTRGHNREMYLKISLTLGQTPPGKYVAEFTIKDKISGKTAAFSTDVEITE